MLQSINPYTQQLIKEYDEHSFEELDIITEKSAQAFLLWRKKSFVERTLLFKKLSTLLLSKKIVFANIITAEMGKPLNEAIAEIEKCVNGINYYAEKAERLLQPTKIETDASESYLVNEPLGPILALMPWNFPFWQVFRCAAPAMMAGNTIVLKLSPNTTGCALAIEEAFHDVGFPDGCFQSVKIQNETSSYLIQKKELRAVSLTGSERAGSIVAAEAGKQLKKTILELGGSDPFIVLKEADLDYTVQMAIIARLQNAGQSCIAAKRFILDKTIAKEFIEKLIEHLNLLKTGNPLDPSVTIGPMARIDLKYGLIEQVKKSIAAGALLYYGSLNENSDSFFSPLILTNVKQGMPAYNEELFGPVFSIIEVDTKEEAIRVANDSPYGLGASIWTKNTDEAKEMALEIESGMVFINDSVHSDVRLPFGGTKISGYGRELSEAGIKEFVNIKTIYLK